MGGQRQPRASAAGDAEVLGGDRRGCPALLMCKKPGRWLALACCSRREEARARRADHVRVQQARRPSLVRAQEACTAHGKARALGLRVSRRRQSHL